MMSAHRKQGTVAAARQAVVEAQVLKMVENLRATTLFGDRQDSPALETSDMRPNSTRLISSSECPWLQERSHSAKCEECALSFGAGSLPGALNATFSRCSTEALQHERDTADESEGGFRKLPQILELIP